MIYTAFKGLINVEAPNNWGPPEFASVPGEAWIRFPNVQRSFSVECRQDGPQVWPSISELSEEESSQVHWDPLPWGKWCGSVQNTLFGRSGKVYPLR